MNDVHYSSKSIEWETPGYLYDMLDKEYSFTLDPCATSKNAKCSTYFTKEDNGLEQSWSGHTVFVNPPYGRSIGKWVRKAYEEYKKGVFIVMLLPARTDTQYFHEYIYNIATIHFIRGRIKFLKSGKISDVSAPFPSMIVIFKPRNLIRRIFKF